MLRFSQHQGRGMFVLLSVVAIALSGCGGNAATPAPSASGPTSSATAGGTGSAQTAVPTGQPSGIAGLSGASSALAGLTSFTFTMTETGGSFGNTLSGFPEPASGTFKLSGTIVLQPQAAADVTVAETLHVINVGGSDYVDVGLSGNYTKNDASNGSQADSLSPVAVFSTVFGTSFDFVSGFDDKGSETKDGVDCEHFTANDTGQSALAEIGSVAGVTADTWAADIWIANNGGYPVSVTVTASVLATATSAAGVVYARSFDLAKVNDPKNAVTAPTNVTGA